MIPLAHDGSADADAAINRAARLLPGAHMTVLTVWEPFLDAITRSGALGLGLGMRAPYADGETIDAAARGSIAHTILDTALQDNVPSRHARRPQTRLRGHEAVPA